MHFWGDEWFKKNGNDLNEAIDFCMYIFKLARIGTHGKEKYGTFRDHVYFWDGGLHTLIWPGYVRIMNSFMYFKLDRYVLRPFTKYSGLFFIGSWIQYKVYNYAFQIAIKRWPNVKDELICSIDYPELIKPGLFGKVDGRIIHDSYWKQEQEDDDTP